MVQNLAGNVHAFKHDRPSPDENGRSRAIPERWRAALRHLDIAFQPIVDIHSGRTLGFEALMRGCQDAGFATPIALLDAADADGVLPEIEKEVVSKALSKFTEIEGHAAMKVFVNLDGRTILQSRGLAEFLLAEVERHGLSRSNLALEISERFNFAADDGAMQVLHRLSRVLGGVTLDDFGAGHANFQLFYHLEPKVLKLDRFLISAIGTDSKKAVFLQHIVVMAHLLGSQVIAEGVETAKEYYVCKELGCDLVQGYLVARPQTKSTALHGRYASVLTLSQNDKRNQETDRDLILSTLDKTEPIAVNQQMQDVFDRFFKERDRAFFTVVDETGAPIGVIHERDLKTFTYSRFGRELMRNPSITGSLQRFVRPVPVANLRASAEEVLEIFSTSAAADGVMMISDTEYAGFLRARSLLKIINEKNLRLARDQNPLSKLPGNTLINEYLASTLRKTDVNRHLVYLDFDNFKPFNDKYGFRTGDRAILICAHQLKDLGSRTRAFVGHVGGDDFFFGMESVDQNEVVDIARQIAETFRQNVESLYSKTDRERGSVLCRARGSEEMTEHALMTLSAAVVSVPSGHEAESVDAVSHQIAVAKKRAKDSADRVFAITL